MKNKKSKITVTLYGNEIQAVMPYSDPTIDEIVSAFVGVLEEYDFNIEDIHQAFVDHLIITIKELDDKSMQSGDWFDQFKNK